MSRPDHYPNDRPQPSGQPYFPPPPTSDAGAYENEPRSPEPRAHDQRFPNQTGAQQHPYGGQGGMPNESYTQFPPPPRSDYSYENASERGYNGAPRDQQRPYAPSEPRPNDGNALAPYDEEKAYAEYTEAYGAPYSQDAGYGGSRRPREDEPERRRYEEERRRYEDERRRYEQREYERERERARERRYDERYESRPPYDDRDRRPSDRYEDGGRLEKKRSPPERRGGKDVLRQGDGERGIGATILGGAAGAFLGNEFDKGALGTIGGALVGAIGANVVEKQVDKRKEGNSGRRAVEGRPNDNGSADPYYGSRGPSVRGESFRPRRAARRRRTHESSDSWTSDD